MRVFPLKRIRALVSEVVDAIKALPDEHVSLVVEGEWGKEAEAEWSVGGGGGALLPVGGLPVNTTLEAGVESEREVEGRGRYKIVVVHRPRGGGV